MLKCIGTKCFYHFNSDIYCKCNMCDKYILPGTECLGIVNIEKQEEKLTTEISSLHHKIYYCKKEIDILKNLQSHIKNNQHLI